MKLSEQCDAVAARNTEEANTVLKSLNSIPYDVAKVARFVDFMNEAEKYSFAAKCLRDKGQ